MSRNKAVSLIPDISTCRMLGHEYQVCTYFRVKSFKRVEAMSIDSYFYNLARLEDRFGSQSKLQIVDMLKKSY